MGLSARAAGGGRAQERLAAGRAGGLRPPPGHPAGAGPLRLGRRRGARRPAALRGGRTGRPAGGAGGGRDRLPQAGAALGGGGTAVQRDAGQAGQLPGGGLPRLRRPQGHAGLDRALYLPQEWTDDRPRCRAAGIPDAVPFRTKPQLALAMVERALDAGVPAAWVVADEVYGNDGKFRRALEARGQAYVVAVRRDYAVSTWPPYGPRSPGRRGGASRSPGGGGHMGAPELRGGGARAARVRLGLLAAAPRGAGRGGVGARRARPPPSRAEGRGGLLSGLRPRRHPAGEIVRAAGARWTIEDTFKLAKGQVGLDHYEARSWRGWYRHITLALLALAALTVGTRPGGRGAGWCAVHVPVTVPEVRRLLVRLLWATAAPHPARTSRGPAGAAGTKARARVPHPAPHEMLKGTVVLGRGRRSFRLLPFRTMGNHEGSPEPPHHRGTRPPPLLARPPAGAGQRAPELRAPASLGRCIMPQGGRPARRTR